MADCLFCDILAGDLPGTFVYRDDRVFALMDIQPVNPGHLMVVPNAHAAFLADLDPETGGHMFRIAQQMARALRDSGLPCEGVNMFLADGEAAMQEIFHVHLHVFPRTAGDGFGLTFGPNYMTKPPREQLEEAAAKIRAAL